MKITKGAVFLLFLLVMTAGMAGAAAATPAEVYADTSSIGTAETGVTYTIPVNVSACGQKLTGFMLDIPQLVDESGNKYADITVTSQIDPDEPTQRIIVPADSVIGRKGTYQWNPAEPNRVVWYYGNGVTLSAETIMFYLNVTVNGSMKYPKAQLPINVTPSEWSVDGQVSQDVTNVTKYITVNYPESVPTSVKITAPTGSLAYKATGTATADVKDQYGNPMEAILTWTSSNPAALLVNDTGAYKVLSSSPGSVNLTATNVTYGLSDNVTLTLTKATPTVADFNVSVPSGVVYDGQPHEAIVTAKAGVEGMGNVTVLYAGNTVAPTAAGEYPITVNIDEGANYTAVTALSTGQNLSIARADLTKDNFTYSLDNLTYDGKEHPISVTVKSGILGAGTITVKYNGTTSVPKNAGNYAVNISITEGRNYTAKDNLALGIFTINKAIPVKADFIYTIPKDMEYDGQPHTVNVTSTNVTGGTITVKYNGVTTAPLNKGLYVVNVSVAGATNYADTDNINLGQFNITKTWPKVTDFTYTAPSDLVYSKSAKSASVNTTVAELAGNFTVKYYKNSAIATPISVGTYTVNVSVKETPNYAARELTVGTFTITAKPITGAAVTLNRSAVTYNGAVHSVSVTKVNLTPSWALDAADYTVGGTVSAVSAGTKTVSVTGKGNYSGTASASWTITKASPTVADFAAKYNGTKVTFPLNVNFTNSNKTVTVSPVSGVYGMGDVTVSYKNTDTKAVETPKKVGSYYVNISVAAGANYTAASNLYLGILNVNSQVCTIAYVTNGGTPIAQETYNTGKDTKVLNTSTKKTGYHLNGWYANSVFTGAKVTQITPEDFGDKTFYAKWDNNTYKVHFDKNSAAATGTMNDQSFTYDAAAVKLTANGFSRVGYQFANWSTNASGTGTHYANEQAVRNLTAENNGVVTLYAVWVPNTYSVHFNGTSFTSGSMDDQQFVYDTPAALNANAFERAGYNFSGWSESFGGDVKYKDNATVKNLTTVSGGIVTLYANWTAAAAKPFVKNETTGDIPLKPGYVVSKIHVEDSAVKEISFGYEPEVKAPQPSGYKELKRFGDAFNITVTKGSLSSGTATVYFNISKNDLNTSQLSDIYLAHQKNSGWEYLKAKQITADGDNYQFSAETTSFSPFQPVYMVKEKQPDPQPSSPSKRNQGSSILLQSTQIPTLTPTPTPTAVPTLVNPTAVPTKTAYPTASAQPTKTAASPVPFVGLLAGLGAAAVLFGVRRS